jgi:hypothetical protein
MAFKITWLVRHRCGHLISWDLSHKRPSVRADFANWLAQRDCTRCWWAKRRTPNRLQRAVTRTQRRAEEAAELTGWETEAQMPVLEGSERAVTWARAIRYRLLQAAHHHHFLAGRLPAEDFSVRFEVPAHRVTSASWWIDHRRVKPSEIAESLTDAAQDPR